MPSTDDDDVDPAYLAIFTEHVEFLRAHLAGRDDNASLPASFFPPNAFWSAAEKDAFFRGLAVHSRLRPDLIAEEVKTKSVPDVCVYLDMLEQAATKELLTSCEWEEGIRERLPIAYEVSEDWLAIEEHLADTFIRTDPEQALVLQERELEVKSHRNNLRPRKKKAPKDRDREGEAQRRGEFDRWLEQKTLEWEEEDALLSLDRASLTTLDRMIREDEERHELTTGTRDPGHAHKTVEDASDHPTDNFVKPVIDDQLIDPVLLEMSRPAVQNTIFPTLVPPKSGIPPNVSYGTPSTSTIPVHTAPEVGMSAPSLISSSFRPTTPPFAPTLLPALPVHPGIYSSQAPDPSSKPEEGWFAEGDISQMSPTSRRRYQKRLHMRRKRAQATGTVADEDIGRLKPGRKPKKRISQSQTYGTLEEADDQAQITKPSSPAQRSSSPLNTVDNEEGEPAAKSAHPRSQASGLTLPYKRLMEFTAKGVDVRRLHEAGLDFFHLQTVSRLMKTYNELHDIPLSVGLEISAETLTLLRIIVVTFLAEVMSRTIVWREQERIAKLQTKVWRLRENQNISAADVKHALALYGAESLNKRAHFAHLIKEFDLKDVDGDGEKREDMSEEEGAGNDASSTHSSEGTRNDEDHDADDEDNHSSHPLSLLRTIFPPFVNLPTASEEEATVRPSTVDPDPSVYMPWPSSSLLSNATDPVDDESLLPSTLNERALIRELHEDEQLDARDRALDAAEEQTLWMRINRDRTRTALGAAEPRDDAMIPGPSRAVDQSPRKRKRTRQARGGNADTDAFTVQDSVTEDGEHDRAESPVRRMRTRAATRKAATTAPVVVKGEPDEDEDRSHRPARKKRMRGTASTQMQLMYREPDPNSRIKSKVYISDSD